MFSRPALHSGTTDPCTCVLHQFPREAEGEAGSPAPRAAGPQRPLRLAGVTAGAAPVWASMILLGSCFWSAAAVLAAKEDQHGASAALMGQVWH